MRTTVAGQYCSGVSGSCAAGAAPLQRHKIDQDAEGDPADYRRVKEEER